MGPDAVLIICRNSARAWLEAKDHTRMTVCADVMA